MTEKLNRVIREWIWIVTFSARQNLANLNEIKMNLTVKFANLAGKSYINRADWDNRYDSFSIRAAEIALSMNTNLGDCPINLDTKKSNVLNTYYSLTISVVNSKGKVTHVENTNWLISATLQIVRKVWHTHFIIIFV